MRRVAQGFSLLEVTLSLGLIALVSTFALRAYVHGSENARVSGQAASFAQFLRQARQRAMSDRSACGQVVLLESRGANAGRFVMYPILPDATGACGASRVDLAGEGRVPSAVLTSGASTSADEWTAFDPSGPGERFAAFDARGASRGLVLDPTGAPPSRGVRFAFGSRRVDGLRRIVAVDAGSGEVFTP